MEKRITRTRVNGSLLQALKMYQTPKVLHSIQGQVPIGALNLIKPRSRSCRAQQAGLADRAAPKLRVSHNVLQKTNHNVHIFAAPTTKALIA